MNTYDTYNLRHEASYHHPIYKGVYWVPVNTLGKTRYKDVQILDFKSLSPEEKWEKVLNLYEAIQILQLGQFKSMEDNVSFNRDNISWAIHTNGRESVVRNAGCCASAANWLSYMLQGKYEEVGVLSILANTGRGHAVNYICHKGKQYVVDTNAFLYEHLEYIQPETGLLQDFRKSKIITGVLLQVDSLEDFTNFYSTYVGRVKKSVFLYCRHLGEIRWEGYRFYGDTGMETFWPEENTQVVGRIPIGITVNLLSRLPF